MLQNISRKRGRIDLDNEPPKTTGSNREKKLRLFDDCSPLRDLPLRLPTPQPFSPSFVFRPALVPALSDDSTDGSPVSTHSPPEVSDDVDMDDDAVSIVESQSTSSPLQYAQSRPTPIKTTAYQRRSAAEGRAPTPIYSNFFYNLASSVPRSIYDADSINVNKMSLHRAALPMAPPPGRFAARDHAMPSPIRESVLSPRDAYLSPASVGSMETSMAAASQMSRLTMNGVESMDVDDGGAAASARLAGCPLSPPPSAQGLMRMPSSGRKRSGALFSEQKTYAVGYRDDCEKCRNKVPGHYSHFLPLHGA